MGKREGEVRKRLVKNEELSATWDKKTRAWKSKVRLTFEFDSWNEAMVWIRRAERGLELEAAEEAAGMLDSGMDL